MIPWWLPPLLVTVATVMALIWYGAFGRKQMLIFTAAVGGFLSAASWGVFWIANLFSQALIR